MSEWDLYTMHGIEIIEGRVWDTVEAKEYPSLADWAEHVALIEDDSSYGGKIAGGGRERWDDE